uniref:Nuclear condensin complex subunit 3 C-terminal domain-containing protein n=1 Tax=Parascaris univalens TaxID=6257 RepID=A0A915BUW0_PARUN
RKIMAAIEEDPDPEGHLLPVYCMMLSQLEVCEWEDIEELNFFRDKAEELVDVLKDMEASAHDMNVLMAFSRSLSRRIEVLEDSSEKWQTLSSPTTDELAVLTEGLHLETPIKGEQKEASVETTGRRFVHMTSLQNGQASTKKISSKPISSSTTRRPPRVLKMKGQDLKKVLMEQSSDPITGTTSLRTALLTPVPAHRLRPVLQRAAKTPAASDFYKRDLIVEEEPDY